MLNQMQLVDKRKTLVVITFEGDGHEKSSSLVDLIPEYNPCLYSLKKQSVIFAYCSFANKKSEIDSILKQVSKICPQGVHTEDSDGGLRVDIHCNTN